MFYPPSPRYLTPGEAALLAKLSGPAKVGLFVDPTDDRIAETLACVSLDVLQVVASPAELGRLRARFGLPVWSVTPVQTTADVPLSMAGADALLLDAKAPPGATRPGGNALPFDWSVLHGWNAPGPWLLAGGLTPCNVAAAIRQTGAPAVDVSSGVERAPGVKDPTLIAAFITAARGPTA